MSSEKQIEAYLRSRVNETGWLCRKFTSPGHAGVPDRTCLLPNGVTWWVEVKKETGTLRAAQERELQRYHDLGHHTAVVYSKDDVDLLIVQMRYSIEKPGQRLRFGW